jgi:hypothetical protein
MRFYVDLWHEWSYHAEHARELQGLGMQFESLHKDRSAVALAALWPSSPGPPQELLKAQQASPEAAPPLKLTPAPPPKRKMKGPPPTTPVDLVGLHCHLGLQVARRLGLHYQACPQLQQLMRDPSLGILHGTVPITPQVGAGVLIPRPRGQQRVRLCGRQW